MTSLSSTTGASRAAQASLLKSCRLAMPRLPDQRPIKARFGLSVIGPGRILSVNILDNGKADRLIYGRINGTKAQCPTSAMPAYRRASRISPCKKTAGENQLRENIHRPRFRRQDRSARAE